MVQMDIRWEKNPKALIANFQSAFPGELDKVVKETSAETLKDIMQGTEVDTGQARRNWFLKKISDSVWEIYNEIPYVGYIPYKKFIGIVKRRTGRVLKMFAAIKPTIDERMQTKLKAMIDRLWSKPY